MHVLVTAGNTLVPIDRVRCLTNIFTGRTGGGIAMVAFARGHRVTLLTSHPQASGSPRAPDSRWALEVYRTFDDLQRSMESLLLKDPPHALIHCAAVSDYLAAGAYAPDNHTRFDPDSSRWHTEAPTGPALVDRSAGKIKSDEPELWLRLVRAPKLIDLVRSKWRFHGVLVKFKLEVGISDDRLLDIAERSRQQSAADLMVANTLEGAARWAFLGPIEGSYRRLERKDLPGRLIDALETLERSRGNG